MTFTWFWVISDGFGCSRQVLHALGWFWVFFAGFGCSHPDLGVLTWFWVFLPGFQCSWTVLGVLGWFWVFSAGFQCSRPVLGVLALFSVSLDGFGCYQLVLGVFGWLSAIYTFWVFSAGFFSTWLVCFWSDIDDVTSEPPNNHQCHLPQTLLMGGWELRYKLATREHHTKPNLSNQTKEIVLSSSCSTWPVQCQSTFRISKSSSGSRDIS